MIHEKTAATLVVGDVLSNNGAVIDQVVSCGHGKSVYIRAKFDDGYTQVVTVPATTPITTWTPDPTDPPPGVFDMRRTLGRAPTAAEYQAERGR